MKMITCSLYMYKESDTFIKKSPTNSSPGIIFSFSITAGCTSLIDWLVVALTTITFVNKQLYGQMMQ
jgi:hypothetical protein